MDWNIGMLFLLILLASPFIAVASYIVTRAVCAAYFRSKATFIKELGYEKNE